MKTFLSCVSAFALASTAALAQSTTDHDMTMGAESENEAGVGDVTMPDESSPTDITANPGAEATTETEAAAPATITSVAQVTTRDDAEKLAETQFLLADANADGTIDKAEFTAFSKSQANFGAPVAAEEPAAAAATTPEQAFTAIAKSDSKISEDELVEARTNSFDAADVNRDKTLDASEQQKFAAMTMVDAETDASADDSEQ